EKLISENKRMKFPIQVVVAGKNPGRELVNNIRSQGWQCFPDPVDSKLNELMTSCSVHLLVGFKTTGIKLKVIRALLTGKPCIITSELILNSGLEKHCIIWDPKLALADQIKNVHPLAENEISDRFNEMKTQFGIEKLQQVLKTIAFL
ncbi:MAG TPA: hypothetical protein VLC28_01395, partial [Flavitalea sp.]|nr:hypothetical protein [Flavitalea sp.]